MIMASRLRDEGGEAIGGTLLVARHDVPVDGQRDGDAGVPEPPDGPDRLAVAQRQGGVRMTKIMSSS
jgi:hypothetical protein